MSDFPDNFDFVICGTGISQSILASALSTTGHSVLHIDKNNFYGEYTGSVRLNELIKLFDEWIQDSEITESNLFMRNECYVKNVNHSWFVKDSVEEEDQWSRSSLETRLRLTDIEIFPKLILCESETVNALIQSDVKRYLEFQFVTNLATLFEEEIVVIPVTRSDIVKTKVFDLKQKRFLTKFLEWCFTVPLTDDLIQSYKDKPLAQLLKDEKQIDEFTEKIILECLILSSYNVKTEEGIKRLKRMLNSFNKVGPYPMLWTNYGTGELPQAFCRMSAVFGGVYSLATSIENFELQNCENGHFDVHEEISNNPIPIDKRRLKLNLTNDYSVYTDRIITDKSNLNPDVLNLTNKNLKWVSRLILITTKSLVDNSLRKSHDILLLPIHFDKNEKPILLLELPIEKRIKSDKDLFIVHFTQTTDIATDPRELFEEYINKFFKYYDGQKSETQPEIVFQCSFTLPEFSNIDIKSDNDSINSILPYINIVDNRIDDFELETCIKESKAIFYSTTHAVVFLPPPPDPANIIQVGDQAVTIGGDAQNVTTENNELVFDNHLNAPGDSYALQASTSEAVETQDQENINDDNNKNNLDDLIPLPIDLNKSEQDNDIKE